MDPGQVGYDDSGCRDAECRLNQSAAISRLPKDVLGIIFELSHHTPFSPVWLQKKKPRTKTELTISHVTRHWRDIAIHSPLLWTYIDVSPDQKLDAITAYTQRSKMCTFAVHYSHPAYAFETLAYERVLDASFDLIIPHVHRWKSIFLAADSCIIERIGQRLRLLEAPLLQKSSRIDIDYAARYRPAPLNDCPPTVFLGGTPILSSVHLQLQGRHLLFFCPSLAAVKNIFLSLKGHVNYNLVSRILASPFLENLDIKTNNDFNFGSAPLDYNIKMLRLHSIRIKSDEYGSITARLTVLKLLAVITAPQLHTLTIQAFKVQDTTNVKSRPLPVDFQIMSRLSKFLLSKFPLLRSLVFINHEFYALFYREFSRSFSTITCLSIAYSYSDPACELLRDMASNPSEYEHWFNLNTISVNIRVLGGIEDALCEIVSNHITAGSPIRKLYLNLEAPLSMLRLEWLRERVDVEPSLTWDDDDWSC